MDVHALEKFPDAAMMHRDLANLTWPDATVSVGLVKRKKCL